MKIKNIIRINFLFMIIGCFDAYSKDQTNEVTPQKSDTTGTVEDNLYKEIIKMDELLFNEAFNKCKFKIWDAIFPDDIEFYDDRSGLNTSRETEVESFINRCSKDFKVTQIQLVSAYLERTGKSGQLPVGFALFLRQEIDDEALQATDL